MPDQPTNAFEFFGIDFGGGSNVPSKVSTFVGKAKEFFGIDMNPQKDDKAPTATIVPDSEHTVETIFPRLIQQESKGVHLDERGKLLKSSAGAEGISQLLPSTAKKPGYGIEPVKDKSEEEYLRVGKEYLTKLYEKFGNWEKALAAYNAGVGNVMKAEGKAERFGGDWKDHLPKKEETLPYIRNILRGKNGKEGAI